MRRLLCAMAPTGSWDLGPAGADHATVGDLCVEMFIGGCVLSVGGVPSQGVQCTDRIDVTLR